MDKLVKLVMAYLIKYNAVPVVRKYVKDLHRVGDVYIGKNPLPLHEDDDETDFEVNPKTGLISIHSTGEVISPLRFVMAMYGNICEEEAMAMIADDFHLDWDNETGFVDGLQNLVASDSSGVAQRLIDFWLEN